MKLNPLTNNLERADRQFFHSGSAFGTFAIVMSFKTFIRGHHCARYHFILTDFFNNQNLKYKLFIGKS